MGLLQQVQDLFNTSNLYEVLGVPKAASEAEVRRGYYKTSLTVHPDRAPEDQQATVKFQALGKVYAVLSDKDQRAVYDEQGIVDEESDSLQDQNRNWEEYWRTMFPKITLQDILDFEKSYKHTDEEKQDLKRVYEESQGDMNKIMESVLCATQEDEARFRDILQAAIDAGELTAYTGFTHESASRKKSRKRKAQKEEKEAEKMQKDMGMTSDSSLVAMIQRKQQANQTGFNSLIANLEDKYCKKKQPRASTAKKGKK